MPAVATPARRFQQAPRYMNPEAIAVLALLGAAIAVIAFELSAIDFVALVLVVALVVGGILTPADALALSTGDFAEGADRTTLKIVRQGPPTSTTAAWPPNRPDRLILSARAGLAAALARLSHVDDRAN